MSKEQLPGKTPNEEVDLLVLFNYFGDRFNRLFNFIGGILKSIFKFFIYGSKDLLTNFKAVAVIVIVAAGLGYGLQKLSSPTYESKMLVRTFFDAKYQLNTNIEYYNALLDDQNFDQLESIFEIERESLETINEFEMNAGPEDENDKIQQYDTFLKSIDSTRGADITFEDFIDNRDIFSGDLFEIRVETTKNDVFKDLETGIYKSFENLYSIEKKRKRDSMIEIRKENLINSLEEIDSLKRVYIQVLEEESKSAQASINLGSGFPLQQEKSATNEYQLLNKEIEIRNELTKLEEEKVERDVFFEVISGFPEIGNKVGDPFRKYMLVFPALAIILILLFYLLGKFVSYVKSYDG